MHVNTVHKAALAKMTKPAVVHPGKILPGKLLFSLSIHFICSTLLAFVYRLYHLGRRGKKETFVCCTSECLGRRDVVQR